MIISLDSLKNNNEDLYESLINHDYRIYKSGSYISEGKFNGMIDLSKKDESKSIVEFKLGNKNLMLTVAENQYIDKICDSFNDKEFNIIYEDSKLFNHLMNLANHVPEFPIDESIYDASIKRDFRKYGINFKKIYDIYMLSRS